MKVKSESEVAQSCPTQRPRGLQPTRLLHPWDFPGKSAGVGCHSCSLAFPSDTVVKNLPAMQETQVQEDPLEKGKATHSSILAWRIPWTVIVHGVTKSRTKLNDFHFTST